MMFKFPVRSVARAMAAIAILGAVACKDSHSGQAGGEIAQTWTPSKSAAAMNISIAAVNAAISAQLAGKAPTPLRKDTWTHAQKLYKNYGNAPLWLTETGLDKPRAGALMLALADGTTDGLRLEDYPLTALGAAIDSVAEDKKPTAEQLANVDVMLTATYVSLGEDLMTGQIDPKTVNQSWHISGKEEKVDSALFRSIRADQLDKAIALMRPRDEGYDSLRVQLARYRELAAKSWTTVPDGKPLKIGESDSPARIAAIRTRLAEEGYFVDSAATPAPATADSAAAPRSRPAVFTRELARAVGQFQSHHGIPVDSSLGSETIAAMNIPASYRASQIATNLERYRWLPRNFGERYVMVNVPAFKLAAYDSGRQVLEMKVIVGQEYEGKATPVFADTMQYVVFRPYWNVTPTIQQTEFAGKNLPDGFEYFQDAGQTRIRQRPGPKNALGLVKFLFPNDYNIYLHDTPNDELFKKDVRAFSHGCIRLEKPDELAHYALGWDLNQIHDAMNSGPDNRTVTLKQPIPVFIVYFTAFVTDGQLFFGNDLYKRDGTMVDMMTSGALPSEDALRATRALHAIADHWGVRDLSH